MADPLKYTYPSPLAVYGDSLKQLPPLPDTILENKSYYNPLPPPNSDGTPVLSEAYSRFTSGVANGERGGFDVHVYYFQHDPEETQFARELWERVRREFPELRIYRFWDRPVGPHTLAMFEVNLFTPAQFGAFVPWLVINRGPLSVLVHPNTDAGDTDEERNHTQRAVWLGSPLPLRTGLFEKLAASKEEEKKEKEDKIKAGA